jgi:hypothetical protein
MDPALATFNEQGAGGGPSGPVPAGEGESQRHNEECLEMAAFRIGETAKRIAVLADRTQDPALRRDLHALRERLLNEERALLSTKR